MNLTVNAVPVQVTTLEGCYKVITPEGAMFYVYKSRVCTCGCKNENGQKCLHYKSVAAYLNKGGLRVLSLEEKACEERQKWEQRISRFRERKVIIILNDGLSDYAKYYLSLACTDVENRSGNAERRKFLEENGIPYGEIP